MVLPRSFPHDSRLLLLGSDAILRAAIEDWLAPIGWICVASASPDALFDADADAPSHAHARIPALALLDGRDVDAAGGARWIAAVRALPGIGAGTPVLLLADAAAPSCAGVVGRIDLPLDRVVARPTLEQWAGPLADHGFRDGGNPHYRLVRLAGRVQADDLISGFADHLEDALARAGRGESLRPIAHRIAGLAGLIGFGELTPLWSALDHDPSADPTAALDASRTILGGIRRRFPQE
ncbi:hypothetical protein BH10PSE13_BH10PSE13_15230 [soil metagenome]